MATYKAHPLYAVEAGDIRVNFDHSGNYETDDQAEIAALDALCPMWVTRVDEVEASEETADKPAAKAPTTRKSSAK